MRASMCITRTSDSVTSTLRGEDVYDEDGLRREYDENEPNERLRSEYVYKTSTNERLRGEYVPWRGRTRQEQIIWRGKNER